MQFDGNLVLYDSVGAPLWATSNFSNLSIRQMLNKPTTNMGCLTCFAAFQKDGNLVLYNPAFGTSSAAGYWATHTDGNPSATLYVSTTVPFLSIAMASGTVVWSGGGLHGAQAKYWFFPPWGSPDYLTLFSSNQIPRSINVFGFAENQVLPDKISGTGGFSDLVALQAFRTLAADYMGTSIEVGVIKPWDCSGQKNAVKETLGSISNINTNGGTVEYLSMDEPLKTGLHSSTSTGKGCGDSSLTDAQNAAIAAQKVAAYSRAVLSQSLLQINPGLQIGDIETYPTVNGTYGSQTDVAALENWIALLGMNGFKPAFFHLDVDLNAVRVYKYNLPGDLKELQTFFASKHIPFGVIYWPGVNPVAADQDYFTNTINFISLVHAAINAPDHSIFESWVSRTPGGPVDSPFILPSSDATYNFIQLTQAGMSMLEKRH